MKATYRVLAHLIALGVVVQAAAIALGVFGLMHDVDNGTVVDKDYDNAGFAIHSAVGMMLIPLLALAFLVIAFLAEVQDGVRWAALVFGAVVLQFVLAFVASGAPVVGTLHGLNALVIFTLAIVAGRMARLDAAAPAHRARARAAV
ncbi:MAG: hypothetical protein ACXV0U_11405 [Kineosporiaceae bacterium]